METVLPILPCPECRMAGHKGHARIGNRRNSCDLCNVWAQQVARMVTARAKREQAELFARLRREVEADLYPQIYSDWVALRTG